MRSMEGVAGLEQTFKILKEAMPIFIKVFAVGQTNVSSVYIELTKGRSPQEMRLVLTG